MPHWQVIVAFAAMAGFMVSIMIVRTNDMDERLRTLEIEMVAVQCAINPELCKAIRRPSN